MENIRTINFFSEKVQVRFNKTEIENNYLFFIDSLNFGQTMYFTQKLKGFVKKTNKQERKKRYITFLKSLSNQQFFYLIEFNKYKYDY